MLLFMPIISTAKILRILGILVIAKKRIRLMTAITPAYAHPYEATCLARHIPAVPHQNFRLPKPKT